MLFLNLRFSRQAQLVRACVTAFGLVYAATAWAAPSDADRAAARQLGYQGVEAYQANDFEAAEHKLRRAFEVVKVPTLGLWLARALAKNGRWIEATEVYREVSRLEPTEGKVEAQREAQRAAASELEALAGKIPEVVIVVEGAASSQVVVEIDDVRVPAAVLGEARPTNPGRHRVVGKFRDQVAEQTVDLAEGQERQVKLVFKPGPAKPVAQKPNAAVVPSDSEPASDGGTQRTAGWVALGVGAAGLITGSVTGLLMLNKANDLENDEHCQDNECEPPAHDEVDSHNRLRTISSVSFIVGGVAAALGATLLLTSGENEDRAVSAYVGVGHLGVRGSF